MTTPGNLFMRWFVDQAVGITAAADKRIQVLQAKLMAEQDLVNTLISEQAIHHTMDFGTCACGNHTLLEGEDKWQCPTCDSKWCEKEWCTPYMIECDLCSFGVCKSCATHCQVCSVSYCSADWCIDTHAEQCRPIDPTAATGPVPCSKKARL